MCNKTGPMSAVWMRAVLELSPRDAAISPLLLGRYCWGGPLRARDTAVALLLGVTAGSGEIRTSERESGERECWHGESEARCSDARCYARPVEADGARRVWCPLHGTAIQGLHGGTGWVWSETAVARRLRAWPVPSAERGCGKGQSLHNAGDLVSNSQASTVATRQMALRIYE